MKNKTETKENFISLVEEPGALSFVSRKEWRELPEMFLGELSQHETILVFYGVTSVFFLLRNMNPLEYLNDTETAFRLVKITTDEDGKQKFYSINLFRAEAAQLMQSRITLWE